MTKDLLQNSLITAVPDIYGRKCMTEKVRMQPFDTGADFKSTEKVFNGTDGEGSSVGTSEKDLARHKFTKT